MASSGCKNFGRSSFQTRFILALVPFLKLSYPFFGFGPIFKCHGKGWRKAIGYPKAKFYAETFEKNNSLKKTTHVKKLSRPNFANFRNSTSPSISRQTIT